MRLCTFSGGGGQTEANRLGIIEGDSVYVAEGARTMDDILRDAGSVGQIGKGRGIPLAEAKLGAPVKRPGKIVAAIVNTKGMLGGDLSLDHPRLDMKAPSTVVGPWETVQSPPSGIRPEVELAAVIGKKVSRISPKEVDQALLGYTILNDLTSPRDTREDAYEAYRRDPKTGEIAKTLVRGTLFRSKNHDGFTPMGPWLVTPDEAKGIGNASMTTVFEGTLIQSGSTSEYIFSPAQLVSYISGFLTLEPGDVVSCGSVGWSPSVLGGLDATEYVLPQKTGTLTLEIAGIGKLSSRISVGRES